MTTSVAPWRASECEIPFRAARSETGLLICASGFRPDGRVTASTFRAVARVTFLVPTRKVTKRSGPDSGGLAARGCPALLAHSGVPRERGVHPAPRAGGIRAARPPHSLRCSAPLTGTPEAKAHAFGVPNQSAARRAVLCAGTDARVPLGPPLARLSSAAGSGNRPPRVSEAGFIGRVARRPRFGEQRKAPARMDPRGSRCRGVLPFGNFSLDKQGKVTRPTGRNPDATIKRPVQERAARNRC